MVIYIRVQRQDKCFFGQINQVLNILMGLSAVLHHVQQSNLCGSTTLCHVKKKSCTETNLSSLFEPRESTHLPENTQQMDASMYISAQMEWRQWQNVLCAPAFVQSFELSAAFNYRWVKNWLQCFKDVKARHASMDRSGVLDTVDVVTCCKLCVSLCVCACLYVYVNPFTLFKYISAWKRFELASLFYLWKWNIFILLKNSEAFLE